MTLRVGLAQLDTRIGDLAGNAARIREAVSAAAADGADLVVLPELCLPGYPPRDLLYEEGFVSATLQATERLARDLAGLPPTLCGTLAVAPPAEREQAGPGHPGLYDAAVLLVGGRVAAVRPKQLLPVYDVFYEPRWFIPGDARPPVEVAGRKLGVLVCEDIWDDAYGRHPAAEPSLAAADVLICPSASPYRQGVGEQRLRQARRAGALSGGRPLVYVNAVGANDELIFDGGSFVLDGSGRLAATLPPFREAVRVVDLDGLAGLATPGPPLGREEELLQALTLGTGDFCRKNGVRRAFVGLSGGVDSALVVAIASRALGPGSVTALALPTRFNDARSTESARLLAERLGVGFEVVPIDGLFTAAEELLRPRLGSGGPDDTTYENVQARLRALVLMAFVNRRGGVLLNTSNKTELTLGYGTLYGDLAGALGVIADLTKPDVYALARHINASAGSEVIPAFILDRPPSAELRPDQVDPFDYGRVSPLVESLVRNRPPPPPLPSPDELGRSRQMVRLAEHKRWQFGIVLKVSERAFGTGRLVPVTRLDPSVPPPGKSC